MLHAAFLVELQVMEEHASRSLGEPSRATGAHCEGHRLARTRKAAVALGEPSRDARAAIERIDELDCLRDIVAEGAAEADIRLRVEELVRAYDPCLSCSVH